MQRLFYLYILLILAGCTDTSIEDISTHAEEEFYATIEGSDSRTYVDNQIRLRWTAEDCVTIFKKTTYNREFMFTGITGANAGGFKQKSVDDDFWYGADVPYNYAVYPHSSTTQLDETDHFFTLTMPSEQTYVENSFGLGANTMVAVSESGQLMFKNVGSYLRVRLYGKNTAVSSITLTSRGNEAIAGKAKVTSTLNGNPTCEMLGSGRTIRLNCPEPVIISEDTNTPTDFWIVVPPVTLSKGFTVTVENDKGDTQVFDIAKAFTFERNMYTNMVREIKSIPYITFSTDTEQTFRMSKAVETLEYSVNNSEWKELRTNIVKFGGSNGNLRIRGKNENGTGNSLIYPGNYATIEFGGQFGPVACSGDIRTLVDYENFENALTSKAKFFYLFKSCRGLISAPELPTTNLADSCYYGMFSYCVSLTSAPQLPATNLTTACYEYMFDNCSNLTIAPRLPATNLAQSCYRSMFKGCSNLITPPQLPATTLAESCYSSMFYDCKKLTVAPQLPAITLVAACYSEMFNGCEYLTTPPILPATTLAGSCYSNMFKRCRRMTVTPELPVTTLAKGCYSGMFQDCDSLENAPRLPATILAESCYAFMFTGCNKLKNAPHLPAKELANKCYYYMFSDCNFTTAPKLPATDLAQDCYAYMFYNCRNLENIPELPATSLAPSCYQSMFSNCSRLTTTPILPAKILMSFCYASMFKNCTNLKNISMLATDISASYSLSDWVNGVSSIGTFTKAAEMTSLPTGDYGIPSGWTVVNYEDTFYDDGPPPMEEEGGNI